MSRTSQRQIIYKLYSKDNEFIRVLNEVYSDFTVEKNLFAGSGPLQLVFSKKIDELPEDITFNNKIKVYIRNKWETEPRLVYYGYIVSIDPNLDEQTDYTGVTCLSAASKLMNDFLRTEDDLAYEIAPTSIDGHIKIILEHYRESLNEKHGSYDRSMIDDPDTYWADTDYIEDTSAIGRIPYRYFNLKHLDAIKEIAKFLPKNDDANAYWYWRINDEGRFILKVLPSSVDHSLILGKHCTVKMRNNIEKLVNRVIFWNDKGDFAGERIRTRFDDDDSQDDYDIVAERISDSQVSTYLQGRLLAESKLMDEKDSQHEATVTVSEANYDILTFQPGQTVKILNVKDENMFSQRMIIQKVVLTEDSAILTLSTPRPELSTQVETDREFIDKQLAWFGEILTSIDGSRIQTGVQHWTAEGIVFTPSDSDSYRKVEWTGGTFILSGDVRRQLAANNTGLMTTTERYYLYLDEANLYCTYDTGKAAQESGTGSVRSGENFFVDDGADWKTDEHKGRILIIKPGTADEERFIISRNSNQALYFEAHRVSRITDSNVAYRIDLFELVKTTILSETGTADSGTTTTLYDSSRTESDGFWNGYTIKFLSGLNAGLTRNIFDFTGGTFTFTELSNAIEADVEYELILTRGTQILISVAIPTTDTAGSAAVQPTVTAVYPEYEAIGSTRAYYALNSSHQLITDIVNDRLNSSSKQILAEFDFGAVNYAGAVKTGDLTWNVSTGAITGGSGVAVYRGGIVGAKNGTPTFTIGISGDAYFAGEISAITGLIGGWAISAAAIYYDGASDATSSGMASADYPFYAGKKYANRASAPFRVTPAGAVYASNITIAGGTVQWSTVAGTTNAPANNATVGAQFGVNISGGSTSTNYVNNSGYVTTITATSITTGTLNASIVNVINLNADNILTGTLTGRVVRTAASGTRVQLDTSGDWSHNIVFYYDDNITGTIKSIGGLGVNIHNPQIDGLISISHAAGSVFMMTAASFSFNRLVNPSATASYDLGSSSYKWRNLYISNEAFIAFASIDYLSQNLNANTYNITNVGTFGAGTSTLGTTYTYSHQPRANNSYDLGGTTYAWRGLFISDGGVISTKDRGSSYPAMKLYAIGGNYNEIVCRSDIRPDTDNEGQLGGSSYRWNNIHSVNTDFGDVGMDNKWVLTESYKIGIKEKGIAVLNEENELKLFIGERGLYARNGKIKNLNELKYIKTSQKEREKIKSISDVK